MAIIYVIFETGGSIVNLYWVCAEWIHQNEMVAYKSTFYATKNDKFLINDYENVQKRIKTEVYAENPILSSLADGPFITCIYRVNPESKMFNDGVSSFIVSFIANTDKEMIKSQVMVNTSLKLNEFNNSNLKDLLTAFAFFVSEVRKEAERLLENEFEDFTITYIHELN